MGKKINYKSLKNKKNEFLPIKIYSRSTIVTPFLIGKNIEIFNGIKFTPVKISEDMIGHKLGVFNNEWKSKYIEKNIEESSLLVFQDIEIKKFIERFFKNSGIIASDINISRCNKNIIILIPYFIVSDCISHIFNDNDFILGNYDNKNNCNPQISTKKSRNYCLSLLRKNYYEKKI